MLWEWRGHPPAQSYLGVGSALRTFLWGSRTGLRLLQGSSWCLAHSHHEAACVRDLGWGRGRGHICPGGHMLFLPCRWAPQKGGRFQPPPGNRTARPSTSSISSPASPRGHPQPRASAANPVGLSRTLGSPACPSGHPLVSTGGQSGHCWAQDSPTSPSSHCWVQVSPAGLSEPLVSTVPPTGHSWLSPVGHVGGP